MALLSKPEDIGSVVCNHAGCALVQVKQLRLEREREKAMRETELEMLQREKEAEHFKTWAEQEDNFHLQQAKLRLVCKNVFFKVIAKKRKRH